MTATTALPAFVPMGGSTLGRIGRVLRTDRLAALGLALIVLVVVLAIAGPWIAPYPAQGYGETNIATRNLAPSALHWFGTDQLGRDILSRVIIGARPALTISLFVVAIAALVGIPLGAIAGYLIANLIVDLVQARLDPRVTLS